MFFSSAGYWPLMTEIHEKEPLAPAKGATGMRRASQLAILLQLAVSSTIWCYLPRRGGQERNARCKWPAYYGGQHQNSGLVGRTLEGPCRLPSLQIARMEPRQSRRKHYAACKRCSGTQHSKLSAYHRWVQNCGHAMFFNAVQIGISVPYSPLPPPPSPPANTLFNLIQPPPPPPPFAFSLPPIPEKKG